ncbi:hypothetical protein S83_047687, partial [Arachis hypogaea]
MKLGISRALPIVRHCHLLGRPLSLSRSLKSLAILVKASTPKTPGAHLLWKPQSPPWIHESPASTGLVCPLFVSSLTHLLFVSAEYDPKSDLLDQEFMLRGK